MGNFFVANSVSHQSFTPTPTTVAQNSVEPEPAASPEFSAAESSDRDSNFNGDDVHSLIIMSAGAGTRAKKSKEEKQRASAQAQRVERETIFKKLGIDPEDRTGKVALSRKVKDYCNRSGIILNKTKNKFDEILWASLVDGIHKQFAESYPALDRFDWDAYTRIVAYDASKRERKKSRRAPAAGSTSDNGARKRKRATSPTSNNANNPIIVSGQAPNGGEEAQYL